MYELVTFDGELMFHNGRQFHPEARFVGFDSELQVFQYIIEHRSVSCETVYDSIKEAFIWSTCHRIVEVDYENGGRAIKHNNDGDSESEDESDYETDEEYDQEMKELEEAMNNAEFMLEFSEKSWRCGICSMHAFTLLDCREKLYKFMERYGHIDDKKDLKVIHKVG